ncbi:glycosyltransferase family 2 protein [Tepidibacter mesophilus]|uniref:glycosyltransferase family 2 protein n=1 Tax=Tepidibacter mesophilus TaxID=655607 RepID=UPI000C073BD6|nr:glycosyltransferase family 2 protein [Tepidibacter mesophilus]
MKSINESSLLSIVVPAYNEGQGLTNFYNHLKDIIDQLEVRTEVIFINDGSKDCTLEVITELKALDDRIGCINFSRNFGKESAMKAGLDFANGDVIIIMDADLEHPPELILDMVNEWQKGYEVVYTKSVNRTGQNRIRKFLSASFYSVLDRLAGKEVVFEDGQKDYILLSRKALDALLTLGEYNRFSKGLFKWIGFRSTEVLFEVGTRSEGASKWGIKSLLRYSLDAITSFSFLPLRISSFLGLVVSVSSFIYMIYIIFDTLANGSPVAGYPTLVTLILFLGGLNLISLGIIGEYLARIFIEVKQRPLYIISDYEPSKEVKYEKVC